jgi:hypothetical protein
MTTDDFFFPVIAFAKDGSILSYPTEAALTQAPKQALKNGYFVGLVIVDSQGQMTTVQSVQQIHKSHSFSQIISEAFSGSTQAALILDPEKAEHVSLDELKARATACLDSECDEDAADKTRQAVNEAASYEIVIRLFYDKPWDLAETEA